MLNTRQLLSEREFLRVAERARILTEAKLISIEYDTAHLIFKTSSSSQPGVYWTQRLLLVDIAKHIELINLYKPQKGRDFFSKAHSAMKANLRPLTTTSIERALRETPIRCSCDCPADLYWGFRYIRWRKGCGLIPEHHIPHYRNPLQKGYVCKHLFRVLTFYPELIPVLEKLLQKQGLLKDVYLDETVSPPKIIQ